LNQKYGFIIGTLITFFKKFPSDFKKVTNIPCATFRA
jgi:hypothetical protein